MCQCKLLYIRIKARTIIDDSIYIIMEDKQLPSAHTLKHCYFFPLLFLSIPALFFCRLSPIPSICYSHSPFPFHFPHFPSRSRSSLHNFPLPPICSLNFIYNTHSLNVHFNLRPTSFLLTVSFTPTSTSVAQFFS